MLIVEEAIEPDPQKEQQVEEINKWIVTHIKPKDVNKDEMMMEKNYEELCLLLGKHTNVPVKSMTVFEYYTLLSLIKSKKIQ